MIETATRNNRQKDLVPQDKIDNTPVTVVGVGAGGRSTAIILATMGVKNLTLIDFDNVEAVNIASQGFFEKDIGAKKTEATAEICRLVNPNINLTIKNSKFNNLMFPGGVCFLCVDSIDTRKNIFKAIQNRADLIIDSRTSAEFSRIFCVFDEKSKQHYEKSFFDAQEAHTGACTSKMTFYIASTSAGIRVAQFAKWMRGIDLDRELNINLLTNELIVN